MSVSLSLTKLESMHERDASSAMYAPNAYRCSTFGSLKEKKICALPRTALVASLPVRKECDDYSYNITSRAVALVGYSFFSLVDACLGVVRWVTTDTGKLKKIQATERALLETHFSELNADRQQLARGITNVVRFIPFIRTPVTLLVDAAEQVNNHNMRFLEKCSKAALSSLAFIPKMACKAVRGCSGLLQRCIRYPRGYCREGLQNPDRLDGDISALFHRLCSFGYSMKRTVIQPHYRTVEKVEQLARRYFTMGHGEPFFLHDAYTTRFFPHQHIKKTDGERCVDRLEQKIGSPLVSQGVFYGGLQRAGERAQSLIALLGKGLAFPFMRAGKKGRYDLKILTALSLKGAELFFATDKGSIIATSLLEKVAPVPLIEAVLQRRVESLVHMPQRLVAWLSTFHDHLQAVRRLPLLAVEAQEASERSAQEVRVLIDQWEEFCVHKNSLVEMCSKDMFRRLNTTRSSLESIQHGLSQRCVPLNAVQEFGGKVQEMRESNALSPTLLDAFLSFFGIRSSQRKCALIVKQREALAAAEKALELAYALQKLQAFRDSSLLLSKAATASDATLKLLFPLLQVQWVSELWDKVSDLLLSYGASLLKFSLLGYDMNEKLTETKKNIILSAQEVSQKALTKAEHFVPRSSLNENRGWSWTFTVLKVALPATITLATSKTATLTTKLVQTRVAD